MTGAEIKQARELRKWSKERLCEAAGYGVSVPILDEIEDGRADVWGAMPKLNRALGVVDFVDDDLFAEARQRADASSRGVAVVTHHSANDVDRFDWIENPDIVIYEQPATAVYRNPNNAVVIRQQDTAMSGDGDQFVFFSTKEVLQALIKALQAELAGW